MTTTESLRRQLNEAFADHQHFHFLIDESWPAIDRALAAAATLELENARLKHIIYRLALGARIINAALSGKTLDQETETEAQP